MIAFLAGRVIDRDEHSCVVLTVLVGYEVHVPCVPAIDADVSLHIHSITKETGTTLYGFESREQRALFVELLDVEGVGPKTAMAVVAAGADVKSASALTSVRGVGAKTAARIVEAFNA